MSYLSLVQISARSAWQTWYECSDRACTDTATAWNWYTATFFSEEANHRYQVIGEIIGMVLAVGLHYFDKIQVWVDAQVKAAQQEDEVTAHIRRMEADPAQSTYRDEWESLIVRASFPLRLRLRRIYASNPALQQLRLYLLGLWGHLRREIAALASLPLLLQ
jgi:hypothetical protein